MWRRCFDAPRPILKPFNSPTPTSFIKDTPGQRSFDFCLCRLIACQLIHRGRC
jgi:hypothetical protein